MKISIGADHAGFLLKESLRHHLDRLGHEVIDHGTYGTESCDYPDFAVAVARDVASGQADRGILVCATGVGMCIAANKVKGIRAALAVNEEEVALVRSHNDANVLTIGAKQTTVEQAVRFVEIFLTTQFQGGRHARRLGKIAQLEENFGALASNSPVAKI